MRTRLILAISTLCLSPAFGQIDPPPGESALGPSVACADLRSLTTYGFTIATAALEGADADGPEYCRVTGQILPEVRFALSLPTSWNRRFLMVGNGGYAGSLGGTRKPRTLRLGFASAITDTGHDAAVEPDAAFAVNRQKLLDYAFRSLHTTAETARRVIEAYYGVKPSRSYFSGCSTGGRQALILAQRFPGDFDGIVAGAPILDFTGTMVRFACTAQAIAAAPIPVVKLPLLAARVYGLCDERDGLKDGLIDDPRRCDFRPSRDLPRCEGGTDSPTCFTTAQTGALEKIYGEVRSGGKRIFPGWPVGAEAAGADGRSGWTPWIVGDGRPSLSAAFAGSFFRYMGFEEKAPGFDLLRFDLEKDVPRLQWIHEILDATDTGLSRFRERGGKLLMYSGWADQALNAQRVVDYYESVVHRMGPGTHAFFRLFMAPGMFHCGGGVGPSRFDNLAPVIAWVERGVAPARILASREVEGKTVRARPLCPYPETARYKGSGSIDEAANFACLPPAEETR